MSGPDALAEWLSRAAPEPILLPDLPIVDPHHHLWDRGGHRYLRDDLLADLSAGHRIEKSVFVECRAFYDATAHEPLQPVGETRMVAQQSSSARIGDRIIKPCAGIVARADLTLGAALGPVLDAHQAASDGRLRGIRYSVAWDASPAIHAAYPAEPGMLARDDVRAGLAMLADRGLAFDAWLYFHQIDDLIAAADAVPHLAIILDHLGGPIGIGPYADQRQEVFGAWRSSLARLAERPNVSVKLGGLGMALGGFGFRKHPVPPSSQEQADAWRPYVETAIDLFGPDRAMFESNFPVDMSSGRYATIWNAFKRLSTGASADELDRLFAGTASSIYKI
ncbi:amidohydrolase family protein [Sphingomonas sp. 1P06PA]|uniref:amidohydrolase family protein n=1 Tax=Sphingomonas sp. 1P06PA TaxID=554121 RepID=UPI0039A5D171